jgi:hypothetical protein
MTCRCNHLPKSAPRKYFNFIKAAAVNARSNVAQIEQPIIAVKYVKHQNSDTVTEKMDYLLCHVSFKSSGGINISTVNALSSVDLYVNKRNKSRGPQKRTWGIEMNEAQETYLKHYRVVDKIDQMLLGWDLTYRSWRWWHAPTRHVKAIAMSIFFVPSMFQRYCGSRIEDHSCIRTKILAEDVSSDGTAQIFKLTVSWG